MSQEIGTISITPLLRRLWPNPDNENVTAEQIALAISHIFTDQLSPVQTGALLTCLHFTGWDRRADVIAKCSEAMRDAAAPMNKEDLLKVIRQRGKAIGAYKGGLVSSRLFIHSRCWHSQNRFKSWDSLIIEVDMTTIRGLFNCAGLMSHCN